MKKKVLFIIKALFSIGLLIVLVRQSEFKELVEQFRNINVGYFAIAIILYLVSILVSTIRWKMLIGTNLRLMRLYSFYLIGGFFSNFLPTMMGGDLVKAYYLYRETGKGGAAMASVFMDRYVGFIGLLGVVMVAYVSGWKEIEETPVVWMIPVVIGGFLAGSTVLWRFRWDFVEQMKKFYEPLMKYRGRRGVIGKTVGFSVIIQLLAIVSAQLIAHGMGIDVRWYYFYIFIPLTVVITMVPISVSGFGVREGAMVYFFGFAGVDSHMALGLSLMWYGSVMVANLLGGVEYVRLGYMDKKTLQDLQGEEDKGSVEKG